MKLITAQELRSLTRPNDDPVSKAIDAINKRVKERQGTGNTDALIGYVGETICFAELAPADREAISSALSLAGYTVTNGPAPKTIKLHWGKEKDEE